jgi:hypothetical protein
MQSHVPLWPLEVKRLKPVHELHGGEIPYQAKEDLLTRNILIDVDIVTWVFLFIGVDKIGLNVFIAFF